LTVIQPGLELPSVADFIELITINSKRRINIDVLNDSGELSDISEITLPSGDPDGELSLDITTLNGSSVVSETYWPNPVPTMRRMKHLTTGKYYITLGDIATETGTAGTYVANWHIRERINTEDAYKTQVLEIVTPRVLSLLPRLRYFLDRSLKVVVPEQGCYLGYTEGQLVLCLRSGLEAINSAQPYVCWATLDAFPIETYAEILIKTAAYTALESTMLFALDTDIPNYNAQGHAFVLTHQQPLAAYLQQLRSELDKRIRAFKLHFVNSGSLGLQIRPDYAFSSLLAAAPFGSIFRGMYAVR
jgi:hypothetical protein